MTQTAVQEQELRAAKAALRKAMAARRRGLDPARARMDSEASVQAILELQAFRTARVVCCYLATPGEVETDAILACAWAGGKTVLVPVFASERGDYGLCELAADTPLATGAWGIREPVVRRWLPAASVDLAVVPGVAFDASGGRLGRGRGYYDRLLLSVRPDTVKVGLAFAFQIVASVPAGEHDVRMDVVAAGSVVYRPGEQS